MNKNINCNCWRIFPHNPGYKCHNTERGRKKITCFPESSIHGFYWTICSWLKEQILFHWSYFFPLPLLLSVPSFLCWFPWELFCSFLDQPFQRSNSHSFFPIPHQESHSRNSNQPFPYINHSSRDTPTEPTVLKLKHGFAASLVCESWLQGWKSFFS